MNDNDNRKKRYTVLTYNFDGYEVVHEIGEKDDDADYILVTDDNTLSSSTWNVKCDSNLKHLSPFDKTFYVRYNCFKYCDTDICVRVDASIGVRHSLKPLIDIFEEENYDACLMPHPQRNNFLEEYKIWIEKRGYPQQQADRCITDMRSKGYDFNYRGMFQTCFSIQRRGQLTDDIDKTIYSYLKELGTDGKIERLDQIPYSFIMNTKYTDLKILPVSEQILRSYYMQFYSHNSIYPLVEASYNRDEPDVRYMFNKEVTCLYLDIPEFKVNQRESDLFEDIRQLKILSRANEALIRKQKKRLAALSLICCLLLLACLLVAVL